MIVLEWGAAAVSFILGVRAVLTPVRFEGGPLPGQDRMLVALYEASRAGFWFALAGLFVGFAMVEDPRAFSILAVVPVILAGLRMLAAVRLARR